MRAMLILNSEEVLTAARLSLLSLRPAALSCDSMSMPNGGLSAYRDSEALRALVDAASPGSLL